MRHALTKAAIGVKQEKHEAIGLLGRVRPGEGRGNVFAAAHAHRIVRSVPFGQHAAIGKRAEFHGERRCSRLTRLNKNRSRKGKNARRQDRATQSPDHFLVPLWQYSNSSLSPDSAFKRGLFCLNNGLFTPWLVAAKVC